MKEFDYVIIGGGCAGLSLAYELELKKKLENKSLAIIEPRTDYSRDKTWSFWKIKEHNFEDCVIKSWNSFEVKASDVSAKVSGGKYIYQSVQSDLFYKKIINKITQNPNVSFFKSINEINHHNSLIFNSVPELKYNETNLWQHFKGVEITTENKIFDPSSLTLMDFNCDQRSKVHFFYVLPFDTNKALIETTWISEMNNESLQDYDKQIKDYIEQNLKIKNFKITYSEQGAIPLFYNQSSNTNSVQIGGAGNMVRLSTGYAFLNIQAHSKYLVRNLENLTLLKKYTIPKKYQYFDKIFFNVLKKHPNRMPEIFVRFFKSFSNSAIRFMSNKSGIIDDLLTIAKMPKWIFIKAFFNNE